MTEPVTFENIQRANFEKLATYLEKLPEAYEHFDMRVLFSVDNHRGDLTNPVKCGAVACALGHGPAAGVLLSPDMVYPYGSVDWTRYCDENFGTDVVKKTEIVYDWVFSERWETHQPNHRAAAARIWYLLDNEGPPAKWSYHDDIYTVY